jgi:hypothetical protein
MDIIRVYPKELYIRLELSESELEKILDFLNACTIDLTKAENPLIEAEKYVTKEFFPSLEALSQQIRSGKT